MVTQRQSPKRQDRKGALTVEFTLVAPIIFFLFFGSLEITAVNILRQSAGNAAYEAARTGVVPGATADDAIAMATEMLTVLSAHRGAVVTVNEELEKVTVTIAVPAEQNSWGLSRYVGGITITESCVLSRDKF
jgi:Flp pilus assembly protein TadG